MAKILLATLDYPPKQGGVARYLDAVVKTYPKEIAVLFWDKKVSRLKMFRDLLQLSKDKRCVFVSHVLPVGTMALLTQMMNGVPYVVFLHGMDFDLARRSRWKKWLTRRILKNALRVITNTEALAREVTEFLKTDRTPLVVRPPVHDEFMEYAKDFDITGKQMPVDIVRLLTVSRLVERKGHLKVLEAMRNISNVEYWIVGEGPFESTIRKKVKELDLESRVIFLGQLSDERLAEVYQQADIFVMPTSKNNYDREGFGIVYLEAQLFGLPVIATNHPGVDEAVIDMYGGMLIRENSKRLKKAILHLVENPATRKNMAISGREFVLSYFTREKQCKKLQEVMELL